ncbi:isocitrate lyase/PEP mutase family protein [Corynebacterium sp. YIM 101645]|uniref:Isocitrate lyase/PEP mutase family protein n=1 Tax=Corynebacterium lemuris TaxID=1859292 RepID=A0ABT2FUE8_9CORY|nr:isocitrate lyase/PEP mutase family protein [Corynebacterium lemuris]MCS5478128.1 isocitrate lyase/PEP mutase family protein [Corynebacterium lemuris]
MNSLRTHLHAGGVIAPGAHDALTAVLAQRAGFTTVYASGFAFEATQLGAPDMGIATMRELADHTARLTAAAPDLNVIVDVDTGFGGPNSLHRTVREFARAGAAAIQIEDQADPKRCPFLGGRSVVDQETAVARVKLAVETRGEEDMLIIARTDADELGFDEVVTRCRRFAEEGADLVLPMVSKLDGITFSDRSPSERMEVYSSLIEAIGHPLVTLDPPPGFTAQDLFDLGVSVVVVPLISLQAAANATISYFDSLRETSSSDAYKDANPPVLEANLDMMKILGLSAYEDRLQALPSA